MPQPNPDCVRCNTGQDDFCSDMTQGNDEKHSARRAKFKGYRAVPEGDDAVMEAVFSQGPLAVSIDAAQVSDSYYVLVSICCKRLLKAH